MNDSPGLLGFLVVLTLLFLPLYMILRASGIFRGAREGFWAGFFHRLLQRRPGKRGGCIVALLLAAWSVVLVAPTRTHADRETRAPEVRSKPTEV